MCLVSPFNGLSHTISTINTATQVQLLLISTQISTHKFTTWFNLLISTHLVPTGSPLGSTVLD